MHCHPETVLSTAHLASQIVSGNETVKRAEPGGQIKIIKDRAMAPMRQTELNRNADLF